MNGLIDTHNFIWWDSNPNLLSPQVYAAIKDKSNQLYLSLASVWEMQIKIQNGKLSLSYTLPETIRHQQETNGIQVLPVSLAHIYAVSQLPQHHRDPFDRVIIAQSCVENLTLLSADEIFAQYPVQLLR